MATAKTFLNRFWKKNADLENLYSEIVVSDSVLNLHYSWFSRDYDHPRLTPRMARLLFSQNISQSATSQPCHELSCSSFQRSRRGPGGTWFSVILTASGPETENSIYLCASVCVCVWPVRPKTGLKSHHRRLRQPPASHQPSMDLTFDLRASFSPPKQRSRSRLWGPRMFRRSC